MSSNSFVAKRVDALRRRAEFLEQRVLARPQLDLSYDKAERAALRWALEELASWSLVAAMIETDGLSDAERLDGIATLVKKRRAHTGG